VPKLGPSGDAAPQRGCEVCGSTRSDPVYRQRFVAFDDASAFPGYDVVTCSGCGFAYADGIPEQSVFDRYYSEMSKYELPDGAEILRAGAIGNYRAIVAEIGERLPRRDIRILDVGSGAGHLLAAFRSAGFTNVRGFDPSARCAAYARRVYGIEVLNQPISSMAREGERYDLVLLSNVLEHLRDLVPTLRSLLRLLAPGGWFWFEVPDAARFAEEVSVPFQQFSLEHINFFTRSSLVSLLSRIGFVPVDTWEPTRMLGEIRDFALDGIFRAGGVEGPISRDTVGPTALTRYVAASRPFQERLIHTLETFVDSGEPVVIWGTGSLTLQLLSDDRLRRLPIRAFVDTNSNYQGKSVRGVPVLAPDAMDDPKATLVIISRVYEEEIANAIRDRYRMRNRVVRLISDSGFGTAAALALTDAR
jgi:SAM-dependent methyltransferase